MKNMLAAKSNFRKRETGKRMVMVLAFWTATYGAAEAGWFKADVTPAGLRCEYLVNPLGIEVTRPRLSWIIVSDRRGERQTAYQVLVAPTQQLLAEDQGDLWDRIEENGKTLWSHEAYVSGVPGIVGASVNGDRVEVQVGSGTYRFRVMPAK